MSPNRGFTFLEILVVMGIFSVVAAFTLFVSMETFRGATFHSDRDLIVASLERARAQSMNNICLGVCTDGKRHGVAIRPGDHPNSYVLFQTTSDYASRSVADKAQDTIFEARETPASSEIVFTQLSGTTTPVTITLNESNRTSVISISIVGQITWTN